jgi:hypothetical protein
MMKTRLEFISVYSKRNIRDPIDLDVIEAKRNEGWEPVFSIGSLSDAIRNPSIAPILVAFKKDEGSADDAETIKKLRGEIAGLKMKLGRLEKKGK